MRVDEMKRIKKKIRSYDEDVDKKNMSKLRFYSFLFSYFKDDALGADSYSFGGTGLFV